MLKRRSILRNHAVGRRALQDTLSRKKVGRGVWTKTIVACFVAMLAVSCENAPSRKSEERPNIILVSIDTLRADHIHGYGYGRETSPALDRLMQRGTSFSAAISSAPWTLPSHVSLLTSLYPHSHGVISEPLALSESVVTLPVGLKLLQSAYELDYGLVLAGAFMASLPAMIVFLLLRRQIIRGFSLASSGTKG